MMIPNWLQRSLVIVCLLGLALAGDAAELQYSITGLPYCYDQNYSNYYSGNVYGVNNLGQPVGRGRVPVYDIYTRMHACTWINGTWIDIGAPIDYHTSETYAINDAGQIAGKYLSNAVIWQDDSNVFLPGLSSGDAAATVLNESGGIAGWATTTAGYAHAVVWRDNATIDLGTLGGNNSYTTGINESGQVCGYSEVTPNASGSRGFIWQDGQRQTIQGPSGFIGSRAQGINDLGQVIGYSYKMVANPGGGFVQYYQAWIWQNGSYTDLGPLPGKTSCIPYAINNSGWIIGDSDGVPFLWKDGTMYDLRSMIRDYNTWYLYNATAISDSGYIVGDCSVAGGAYGSYVLQIVPEPCSILTILAGTAGTAVLALRRKK